MVEKVEAGSIFPLRMLAYSARGDRDPRMHRCVARTIARLILDFMKFVVSEEDFPDFWARRPARFCRATTASFGP